MLVVLVLLLAAGLVHGAHWAPLALLGRVRDAPKSLLRYVRHRLKPSKRKSLTITVSKAVLEQKDAQIQELTDENNAIKEQKEQFRKTLIKTKSQLGMVKKEKEVIRQHYTKIVEELESTIANDKAMLNQKLENEKIKLLEKFNDEKKQLIQNHEVEVTGYKTKLVAAEKEISYLKDHFKTKVNELNKNSKIEIEKLRKNLESSQSNDPVKVSSSSSLSQQQKDPVNESGSNGIDSSRSQRQKVPVSKVINSTSDNSPNQQQKVHVSKVSSGSSSSYSTTASKPSTEKPKIPVMAVASSSRSSTSEDRTGKNRSSVTDRPKSSTSKMKNSKKSNGSKPSSRKPSNSRK